LHEGGYEQAGAKRAADGQINQFFTADAHDISLFPSDLLSGKTARSKRSHAKQRQAASKDPPTRGVLANGRPGPRE
jgi:hypothetical protein